MRKDQLPEWVKKFDRKGVVFRKKGDSFVMLEVKSHRVAGRDYPVLEQTYLGMVTTEGFFPAGGHAASTDHLVECGLSHFILENFHRELFRSVYNSADRNMTEGRIRAGIVLYIYGVITDATIGLTLASAGYEESIRKIASSKTVTSMSRRIDELMRKSIPDETDRIVISSMLRQCMTDRRAPSFAGYPADVMTMIDRIGGGLR